MRHLNYLRDENRNEDEIAATMARLFPLENFLIHPDIDEEISTAGIEVREHVTDYERTWFMRDFQDTMHYFNWRKENGLL